MDYSFEKDWDDYIKSKNDILKKLNLDKIRRDELLKIADCEIDEMRVKLAKLFMKSLSDKEKTKAKQELSLMDKSRKHLDDFRRGKIAGVLVQLWLHGYYGQINFCSLYMNDYKEYWNSIIDEKKTNAIIIISKIQKSLTILKDFRSGKITGVIV